MLSDFPKKAPSRVVVLSLLATAAANEPLCLNGKPENGDSYCALPVQHQADGEHHQPRPLTPYVTSIVSSTSTTVPEVRLVRLTGSSST